MFLGVGVCFDNRTHKHDKRTMLLISSSLTLLVCFNNCTYKNEQRTMLLTSSSLTLLAPEVGSKNLDKKQGQEPPTHLRGLLHLHCQLSPQSRL